MQSWDKNSLKIAIEQIQSNNTSVQQASKGYNTPLSILKRGLREHTSN